MGFEGKSYNDAAKKLLKENHELGGYDVNLDAAAIMEAQEEALAKLRQEEELAAARLAQVKETVENTEKDIADINTIIADLNIKIGDPNTPQDPEADEEIKKAIHLRDLLVKILKTKYNKVVRVEIESDKKTTYN